MMNQQPDKIFRDKLEGYQRSAPAPAWDRIEAALDKKNNVARPWLKIAAALLLMALTAWIFWPKNSSMDNTPQTAEEKRDSTPQTAPPVLHEKPLSEQHHAIAVPKEKNNNEHRARKKTSPPSSDNKMIDTSSDRGTRPKETDNILQEDKSTTPDVAVIEQQNSTAPVAVEDESDDRSMKIVFTANDSEKYLVKKSSDATTDTKKQSRLQKLLDKAEDLTTNQDPIGEIRQVKNEILALNFRSEKSRGQNK